MPSLTPNQSHNLDIERIRQDFPILKRVVRGKPLVYLDNAATTQKPQTVIDALSDFWTHTNANIHRGVHTLSQESTAAYDASREKVRVLLNAKESAEVIFTKGCTEGINLVARSAGLQPGEVVLVTTLEHHSNIVPWQLNGARTVPVPISDEGIVDLNAFRSLLAEHRPRYVGLVHVSNALGTVNPIKEMVRLAHEHGALALVDGAQAGPHLSVDVQDLDADFYTLSCHKVYAPTGVGVLYGKRALLEAIPPYLGGGDMIRTVSFEKTTFADLPAKFEAGTPDIGGVVGLGAAIDYLALLGGNTGSLREDLVSFFNAASSHESHLVSLGTQLLEEIPGVHIVGKAPQKAGILSFVMDGIHPHDIGTILDVEGVAIRAGHHCCMPLMKRLGLAATARASLAVYTNESEIEALAAAVRKVRAMFGD